MKTKTWPYGTTRKGTVILVARTRAMGQLVKDECGEGHVLLGTAADSTAHMGDTGTLTFTKGGPTGGYWKFTKDP